MLHRGGPILKHRSFVCSCWQQQELPDYLPRQAPKVRNWQPVASGNRKVMVPIEGGNEGVDRSNDFVVAIVDGGEPTHVGPAHNRVLALGPRQEVAVLLVAVVDGLVPRALGIHIHNGVQEAAASGEPWS